MKEKLANKNFIYLFAGILCLISIFMIFASSFTYTVGVGELRQVVSFKGYEAVFGNVQNGYRILNFSIFNLLSYILVCVALILLVLRFFNVIKSKNIDYIIVMLLVVACIFFFCCVSFVRWNPDFKADLNLMGAKFALGSGSIVSAIFTLVAAVLIAIINLLRKDNKV